MTEPAPVADIEALLGPATNQRITAVSPSLRQVHRTILRAFAETGRPPARADIDTAAIGLGLDPGECLATLAAYDIIGLNEHANIAGDLAGDIAYAYPFSAHPTTHRLRLPHGTQPYAMCAIDALGIPTMLDADAVITSTDPRTGEPITITVTDHGATATWQPPSCVAFVGSADDCCASTLAQACCTYLNFFTCTDNATHWSAQHPHVRGVVLDQDRALRLGVELFGDLLHQDASTDPESHTAGSHFD